MNLSTVFGLSINYWVKGIIQGKVFDHIHGQPTNETMNTMDSKMVKVCATVPTTAWVGKHGCLALVLTDAPYQIATNVQISTNKVGEAASISQALTPASTPKYIEATMKNHARDDNSYKIQEATKRYGLDMIVAVMDPQYTAQLDK